MEVVDTRGVSQHLQERNGICTSDALAGLSAFRMGSSALHFQSSAPKKVRRAAIIKVTVTTAATPIQLHMPSQSSSSLAALHSAQTSVPNHRQCHGGVPPRKVQHEPPIAQPPEPKTKAHLLGTVLLGAITAGALSDKCGPPERSNEM